MVSMRRYHAHYVYYKYYSIYSVYYNGTMHILMLSDIDCRLLAWRQKLVVSMALCTVLLKQDRCCKLLFTTMAYICGCNNHVSFGLHFSYLVLANISRWQPWPLRAASPSEHRLG